jgi:uncharacterized membrane protein YpjA
MIQLNYLLKQRWVLVSLLIINILGTIYGYIWYRYQLAETPPKFLIFVPDSPTASLFFVFVLIAFLMKKNVPLIEALAVVTLFKYGIWAVGMNLAGGLVSGSLNWINFMLIFSHFGMALEGLFYTPFYRFKAWHLAIAAVWTLHNDVIDYVFGMLPQYPSLFGYESIIGYWTFWLSIVSIFLGYYYVVRRNRNQLSL